VRGLVVLLLGVPTIHFPSMLIKYPPTCGGIFFAPQKKRKNSRRQGHVLHMHAAMWVIDSSPGQPWRSSTSAHGGGVRIRSTEAAKGHFVRDQTHQTINRISCSTLTSQVRQQNLIQTTPNKNSNRLDAHSGSWKGALVPVITLIVCAGVPGR
jgi:hypothetical protein